MRNFDSSDPLRIPIVDCIRHFRSAGPTLCHGQDDALPQSCRNPRGHPPRHVRQKAYEILKAEAGAAQIGIGEYPTAGVSTKPAQRSSPCTSSTGFPP